MPTFPTPEPIAVTFEVTGAVRFTASDRADTVVAVRPAAPSKAADVRAAEQTTVDCGGGTLQVKTPRGWRHYTPFGGHGIVDVAIELPTGSHVTGDSALGDILADGELGACRVRTAMGNIRLDQTGPLRAVTGFGSASVDHVVGDAEVKTGSGDLHVGFVQGAAVIRNSNGATSISEVTGDLRVKAANGSIVIGRAHTSAVAKTANGEVRIGEVSEGAIVLETAAGSLEVGVREGTAAWLDVHTRFGVVRNALDMAGPASAPAPTGATVQIRARTSAGDIVIGRAVADSLATSG
jgi:hypothetical protein